MGHSSIPGLDQIHLSHGLYMAAQSASDGNTGGLMLAFVDNRGVGFSFLVRQYEFSAAFYAVPSRAELIPKYSCTTREGWDGEHVFVAEYLQAAAVNMGIEYPQLVWHFAQRNSHWRFQPWEYGVAGRSQDNDTIWRKRLWPSIREMVANPPQCTSYLPEKVRTVLLRQLRGHATEGMIVLER